MKVYKKFIKRQGRIMGPGMSEGEIIPPDDKVCWWPRNGSPCMKPAEATFRKRGTHDEVSVCQICRPAAEADSSFERVAQFEPFKVLKLYVR